MGRFEPLRSLPARFGDVEQLLSDMPITKPDGSKGHLAHGTFGDAVAKNLAMHRVDSSLRHCSLIYIWEKVTQSMNQSIQKQTCV